MENHRQPKFQSEPQWCQEGSPSCPACLWPSSATTMLNSGLLIRSMVVLLQNHAVVSAGEKKNSDVKFMQVKRSWYWCWLPLCDPCTYKTYHTAVEVKQDALAEEAKGQHANKPQAWLFQSLTLASLQILKRNLHYNSVLFIPPPKTLETCNAIHMMDSVHYSTDYTAKQKIYQLQERY